MTSGTKSSVCVCVCMIRSRRRGGGCFACVPSNSFIFRLSSNSDSQHHLTTLQGFHPGIPASLGALSPWGPSCPCPRLSALHALPRWSLPCLG